MFVVSMPQKLYNKYLDKRDDAMDAKAVVEDSRPTCSTPRRMWR